MDNKSCGRLSVELTVTRVTAGSKQIVEEADFVSYSDGYLRYEADDESHVGDYQVTLTPSYLEFEGQDLDLTITVPLLIRSNSFRVPTTEAPIFDSIIYDTSKNQTSTFYNNMKLELELNSESNMIYYLPEPTQKSEVNVNVELGQAGLFMSFN